MRPQPMRIRARLRDADGVTEVLLLMPHPMETGLRRGDDGQPLPPHHITELLVTLDGRTVFAARTSFAVARDPLMAFRFTGAVRGQRLRAAWTDNLGRQRSDEAVIA